MVLIEGSYHLWQLTCTTFKKRQVTTLAFKMRFFKKDHRIFIFKKILGLAHSHSYEPSLCNGSNSLGLPPHIGGTTLMPAQGMEQMKEPRLSEMVAKGMHNENEI